MFDVLGHSNKTQQLGLRKKGGPNPRLGTESASGFGPGGTKRIMSDGPITLADLVRPDQ